MTHRFTIRIRPKAFSPLKSGLDISILSEAQALYLFDALKRAGESVELLEERVEVVRKSNG